MVTIKGFNLTDTGDVEIKNNKIVLLSGDELLRQTIEKVLNTNKGEWFGNEDEGITFQNILGKNIDEETIKNEILEGLLQIDSSFILSDFSMSLDENTRGLTVSFKATNEDGETIETSTKF